MLLTMKNWNGGAMKDRLEGEMQYARRVSLVNGKKFDALIENAFAQAKAYHDAQGAVTKDCVRVAEEALAPMTADCKKFRLLFVGHAHIDMNWMWRFDETVAVTLDTFRTALNLMKEFPHFTFAQSQASVYRIVEQYEPAMLEEIRQRIKAGQWEVSASTWVEADRNMPSLESVARHHLYTASYLPKLLGIDAKSLNLDYEPDTFGHHQNVPEMLAAAGVKYYYHCRGEEKEVLYRWQSPSGREILVYREPDWYLGPVAAGCAAFLPEYCDKYGVDTGMNVYGVGDHGGGPTRRDLETIDDMMTWPVYPTVEYGTYQRFFEAMEQAKKPLPVLTGERNPVFSGCYTTQTRIKQGNRMGEKMMFEGEEIAALAKLNADGTYPKSRFVDGWRNILFNQFHDIIPGSGVVDTRECAMGQYQEAFAIANTARRNGCAALAARVNTRALLAGDPTGSISEGAGVGYGIYGFKTAQVERGGGNTRLFHLFNTLPFARSEVVELTLWDFRADPALIEMIDGEGKPVQYQLLDAGFNHYWGHHFARILIEAKLPASGYATYGMRLKEEMEPLSAERADPRVEKPIEPVLENDKIRAEFDVVTGEMISLVDKATGSEMLAYGAQFDFVNEDPSSGMTAWIVGRWRDVKPVDGVSKVTHFVKGPLMQSFDVTQEFGASKLTYTVSLAKGASVVNYDVKCDWQERGDNEKGIPQLRFRADHAADETKYLYDIPGGVIERDAVAQDQCSQGMIATTSEDVRLVMMSDCKYGFRGDGMQMGVTLLRSSFDPDPYPELGEHTFRIALGVSAAKGNAALLRETQAWNHPATVVSGTSHDGDQPLNKSFVTLRADNAILSAVKLSEEDDSLIVRLYETDGAAKEASLDFGRTVKTCVAVDAHEHVTEGDVKADGSVVSFVTRPYGVQAVKVTF